MKSCITIRQGDIGKLIEYEPDRYRQRPHVYLVRLVVQFLKRLRVKHTYKEIQAVVIAVGDNAKDGLFSLSQL